jgi:transposase
MARRLKIQAYLDSDALEKRYRNAQDGVERSQWQMIWLLSMGKTSAEVAAVTGYCVDWIRKVVRRYNMGGPAVVGDRRHHNPGQPRLLNAEQEAELLAELDAAAAAGQAWSSVQVAAWMSAQLGRPIRQGRGWDTLQRLTFTTKTPRTRHAKADGEAQELFKKSLS